MSSAWPRPSSPGGPVGQLRVEREALAARDVRHRLEPWHDLDDGGRSVDALACALDGYHLLHAARGDALDRLGRHREAAAAFERAIELTANAAEVNLMRPRRDTTTAISVRASTSSADGGRSRVTFLREANL